ncbi:MAG: IS66 family transposase [Myxococcota bacterium]
MRPGSPLNDRHVVYDYTPTKHGTGPAAYVADFKGVFLADGGSEFNEAVRRMGLIRAGCWCHARRYFFDAKEHSPALAAEALKKIGVLFDIERAIAGADLETRQRVRGTDTRAALDDIKTWLVQHVHRQRPKSPLGQAMNYPLNQWAFLEVCVTHPEIPIHNNLSELQLRLPVVGRKNWLFAGSEGGAATAATLFSVIGSCRLYRLDPWEYLVSLLGRINDHSVARLSGLTPAAYAASK